MEYLDKVNYTLVKMTKKNFSELVNGLRLFDYRISYIKGSSRAFVVNEDGYLMGMIDYEEAIEGSKKELLDFSSKYDLRTFDGDLGDKFSLLPVSRLVLIKETPIDFDIYPEEYLLLDEKKASYLLKLIKSNYLEQVEFEQELKVLVDEERFKFLYNQYIRDKNPKRQVNYYFDNNKTLINQGSLLRIRELGGNYVLTLKQKKHKDQSLSLEKTESLPPGVAKRLIDEKKVIIQDHIDDSIRGEFYLMGSLETIRDKVKVGRVEVFFDENTYFDKKDFEIEVEGKNKDLIDFFEREGLSSEKGAKNITKIERFLKEFDRH